MIPDGCFTLLILSLNTDSESSILPRFINTANHRKGRASPLWPVTVLLLLWKRGDKKECHDQVFTMMRLDTCHCLSCSYSFFAASTSLCIWSAGLVQSFCKSGHFNHLALSTSGELSQNGRNIPESMHRMRYTLLFPLEWLQVNKLMPVEDAGNPRCQHKDFQPSSFFFPVAWSRTGAGLMLSQSAAGDGCTWAELLGDKGNQKVENRLPCCLTYCCTQTVKRQGRWQEQEKVTIITICCSWDTLC